MQLEEHRVLQTTKATGIRTWHRRLGHLNVDDIRKLAKESAIDIYINEDHDRTDICIACLQGKQHMNINRKPAERAVQLGSLIHSDLCGPIATPSHSGYRYFIIYVDDWSRYIWVYFLRSKTADEISTKFREFQVLLETESIQRSLLRSQFPNSGYHLMNVHTSRRPIGLPGKSHTTLTRPIPRTTCT